MKTIDNLNIAPERVLNDDELIQLKGGKKKYKCTYKSDGVTLTGYGYANSDIEAETLLRVQQPYAYDVDCNLL